MEEASAKFKKWEIQAEEIEWDPNQVLGEGTFGRVYRGKCRKKEVAVKRLQRQLKPENLRTLIEEVDLMR